MSEEWDELDENINEEVQVELQEEMNEDERQEEMNEEVQEEINMNHDEEKENQVNYYYQYQGGVSYKQNHIVNDLLRQLKQNNQILTHNYSGSKMKHSRREGFDPVGVMVGQVTPSTYSSLSQ